MAGRREEARILARVKHVEDMEKTALKLEKRQNLLESRKILKNGVRCRFPIFFRSPPTIRCPRETVTATVP